MQKSTKKKNDSVSTDFATSQDCILTKPDLKGDWLNFYVLLLLYVIQGLPFGMSLALPIILQSKQVSYQDQAVLSFVLWPYSMRILWAPIIDAIYIQRIGKRKSWLIPLQYLMGMFFIFIAYHIDDWLPEIGKPNLKMIVCVFFIVNYLCATQDIVVDGWALTMMRKNNVSYASTCNGTGLGLGMFVGSIFPVLLVSEDFCNKYLRITSGTGGIMTFKSFLYCWGILLIIITTLLAVFKKENEIKLDHVKTNILHNYKILWDVFKIPSIRILTVALLTGRIGFSAMEAVSNLKLIDAGITKDDITIMTAMMYGVKICMPLFVAKYTSGPKPMSFYLKLTPIRLLWCLPYTMLIYYTPKLIKTNGVVHVPIYYYFALGLIFLVNDALFYIMSVAMYAFFARISDPRYGGTYMTLFNTISLLGWVCPNTLALNMVDILTFRNCSSSNSVQRNCSTLDLQKTHIANEDNCVISIDGYYVEIALCLVTGLVWYFFFKNIIENLQTKSPSHWTIKMNAPICMT